MTGIGKVYNWAKPESKLAEPAPKKDLGYQVLINRGLAERLQEQATEGHRSLRQHIIMILEAWISGIEGRKER